MFFCAVVILGGRNPCVVLFTVNLELGTSAVPPIPTFPDGKICNLMLLSTRNLNGVVVWSAIIRKSYPCEPLYPIEAPELLITQF